MEWPEYEFLSIVDGTYHCALCSSAFVPFHFVRPHR